jgi:hypothetical protein
MDRRETFGRYMSVIFSSACDGSNDGFTFDAINLPYGISWTALGPMTGIFGLSTVIQFNVRLMMGWGRFLELLHVHVKSLNKLRITLETNRNARAKTC